MKIASWNVNSLKVRLPHLTQWLAAAQPDVVALQEITLVDAEFPHAELERAGYRALVSGQKTYNGVALLTRVEALDPVRDIPGFEDPQRRVLAATVGELRVVDLYVVNGQEVGSEKFEAHASVAEGEERDRLYRQQAAQFDTFNDYEKRTTRRIPVVILTRA